MSGTLHFEGPVTRGRKLRASEEEEKRCSLEGDEPMIPVPSRRRIWITRHKSELRGQQHPSVRADCTGGLLREGEEISHLSIDETGRTQVVGKYICGGDSYFYAKRFNGQYHRLLQFVSRGSEGYESKYFFGGRSCNFVAAQAPGSISHIPSDDTLGRPASSGSGSPGLRAEKHATIKFGFVYIYIYMDYSTVLL